MTQEEKAKAYDEAVKKVKDYYEGKTKMYSDVNKTLNLLFPELAESEDERIRKKLIFDFQVLGKTEWGDLKVKDILAWLEKQGGTYTKRDVDDAFVEGMALAKDELEKQGENKQNLANSAKTCKKSQRMVSAEAKEALYDKPAWSEEDEEMLDGIILRCEKYGHQEQINWLKSIKQRIKGE